MNAPVRMPARVLRRNAERIAAEIERLDKIACWSRLAEGVILVSQAFPSVAEWEVCIADNGNTSIVRADTEFPTEEMRRFWYGVVTYPYVQMLPTGRNHLRCQIVDDALLVRDGFDRDSDQIVDRVPLGSLIR